MLLLLLKPPSSRVEIISDFSSNKFNFRYCTSSQDSCTVKLAYNEIQSVPESESKSSRIPNMWSFHLLDVSCQPHMRVNTIRFEHRVL